MKTHLTYYGSILLLLSQSMSEKAIIKLFSWSSSSLTSLVCSALWKTLIVGFLRFKRWSNFTMAKNITIKYKNNEQQPPVIVETDSAPLILNYGTVYANMSTPLIMDEKPPSESWNPLFDVLCFNLTYISFCSSLSSLTVSLGST